MIPYRQLYFSLNSPTCASAADRQRAPQGTAFPGGLSLQSSSRVGAVEPSAVPCYGDFAAPDVREVEREATAASPRRTVFRAASVSRRNLQEPEMSGGEPSWLRSARSRVTAVNRKQRRAMGKPAQAARRARARFTEEGSAGSAKVGWIGRGRSISRRCRQIPRTPRRCIGWGSCASRRATPRAGSSGSGNRSRSTVRRHATQQSRRRARGARQIRQAVDAYSAAIAIEPGDVDALNNRGNALYELHRHG